MHAMHTLYLPLHILDSAGEACMYTCTLGYVLYVDWSLKLFPLPARCSPAVGPILGVLWEPAPPLQYLLRGHVFLVIIQVSLPIPTAPVPLRMF